MRIQNLTRNSLDYSSNVYLVQGDWNTVDDVNTLIDVGADIAIISRIKEKLSGIGKKKIDRVLLTHADADHIKILPEIRTVFSPQVFGYAGIACADTGLKDGELIRIGDRMFKALRAHIHGDNSLLFVCEEEGVVFTGDAPVYMCHENGSYSDKFLKVLRSLTFKNIKRIYPGHGQPVLKGANRMIMRSFLKARKAKNDS